jgi:DNA repair protein RadC
VSIVEILTVLRNSRTEKFAVFYHTTKGVFGEIVAEGDEETVTIPDKLIVHGAAQHRAKRISFAHNHPRGEVRPSEKDLLATFQMQDLFKSLGLELHDHIIVGPEGSPFSMLKEGVI